MDIADALTSAAKGAAAGAVAGPVGAAVGGLGGLVLDMAPSLGKWLFGDSGGQTVAAVADAVKSVTGTADADAALAALAKDPQAAINLRIQLAQIAAQREAEQDKAAEAARQAQIDELKARIADVTNARGQTVALAQAGSDIAWSVTVLSALILITFAIVLALVLTRTVPDTTTTNIMIGALVAMTTQVANYWLGSSSGSAEKARHIATIAVEKVRDTVTSIAGKTRDAG